MEREEKETEKEREGERGRERGRKRDTDDRIEASTSTFSGLELRFNKNVHKT